MSLQVYNETMYGQSMLAAGRRVSRVSSGLEAAQCAEETQSLGLCSFQPVAGRRMMHRILFGNSLLVLSFSLGSSIILVAYSIRPFFLIQNQ